jgi:nucleoside-diphosphate-sugar epimerase
MRVVITAMGGLKPELCLLIGELSRRFDSVRVWLGADTSASLGALRKLGSVELGHWSVTEGPEAIRARIDGADAVVHIPPPSDEALRQTCAATLRSIAAVADAAAESKRKPCSFVSVLTAHAAHSGDTCESETTFGADSDSIGTATKQLRDAGVRMCVARTGVVLRTPTGPLGRTLCALKTQGASTRVTCSGLVRWIHILDAVRAVAHMLGDESLSGQLNLVAPEPVAVDRFANAVWTAFGLPPELRRPASGFGRLLPGPRLDTRPAAEPLRLVQSGFSYLFPDLQSALTDIAQSHA